MPAAMRDRPWLTSMRHTYHTRLKFPSLYRLHKDTSPGWGKSQLLAGAPLHLRNAGIQAGGDHNHYASWPQIQLWGYEDDV